MAEPKCPKCNVEGGSYIISQDSEETSGSGIAWFNIAHCSECGHVYGIFAKTTNPPPAPKLPIR